MSKMDQTVMSLDQTVTSLSQTLNSHSQSIARIEVQLEQIANQIEEEELQNQLVANLDGHYMMDESTSYHEQVITTLKNGEVVETHVENRNEEQIEAPQALHRAKGEEVSTVAPSSSTLIVEMLYELRAPILGNLKISFLEKNSTLQVIIAYDLTKGNDSSLLGLLEEQKKTIKVENFLEYSHHFTQVHNSLPDKKQFENIQRDLP
jgi:multidrug efflux pump subunit AcrA (membrane-fusion protein)